VDLLEELHRIVLLATQLCLTLAPLFVVLVTVLLLSVVTRWPLPLGSRLLLTLALELNLAALLARRLPTLRPVGSPTGGKSSPMVTVLNHSAWYACHSAVVAKESWLRGSPAAADAASCAALKTVGISGVRRAGRPRKGVRRIIHPKGA